MKTQEIQFPESVLNNHQRKNYGPKFYQDSGTMYKITATVRYDDACNNGTNSFSITASIDRKNERGQWVDDAAGCCHYEVAKHFPELAPLIKWHLVTSKGPLYYVENTIYHAGDRDHWGLKQGEFRQYRITGEGKKRELDHARSSAVWPEATDEQLTKEPEALRAALLERLPALMLEFKAAVESLGFKY